MTATMSEARPRVTMKAWVAEGSGSADVLQLREIDRPAVPDDRILVKVRASSVNAADYHALRGGLLLEIVGRILMRGRRSTTPAGPEAAGSDVAGTVVEVGKSVTSLRPGDEVFGTARGSWAEYAVGTERGLLPKPMNLSFVEGATLGVAASTALQGLRDRGALKPGQRVLIYGAGGGVGTFAVQIAKALGAHVTAVTGPRNMDVASHLGADVLIDYQKENVAKRPERYDLVYDVAGIRPIGELRRLLVPGGLLVLAGAAKKGGFVAIIGRLVAAMFRARVLKQRVVFYIASIRHDDLAYLGQLVAEGSIRPSIDRTYPLAETREAVRYAMTGQARAKVVLIVD